MYTMNNLIYMFSSFFLKPVHHIYFLILAIFLFREVDQVSCGFDTPTWCTSRSLHWNATVGTTVFNELEINKLINYVNLFKALQFALREIFSFLHWLS